MLQQHSTHDSCSTCSGGGPGMESTTRPGWGKGSRHDPVRTCRCSNRAQACIPQPSSPPQRNTDQAMRTCRCSNRARLATMRSMSLAEVMVSGESSTLHTRECNIGPTNQQAMAAEVVWDDAQRAGTPSNCVHQHQVRQAATSMQVRLPLPSAC